jgi:hypothetical protein
MVEIRIVQTGGGGHVDPGYEVRFGPTFCGSFQAESEAGLSVILSKAAVAAQEYAEQAFMREARDRGPGTSSAVADGEVKVEGPCSNDRLREWLGGAGGKVVKLRDETQRKWLLRAAKVRGIRVNTYKGHGPLAGELVAERQLICE